jgi:hypothetical protein
MNEFQIRSLFENRFGGTPESFGLSVVDEASGVELHAGSNVLKLSVVNGQQAGWHLNGELHTPTPPNAPVLKPQDPARSINGAALRAALV